MYLTEQHNFEITLSTICKYFHIKNSISITINLIHIINFYLIFKLETYLNNCNSDTNLKKLLFCKSFLS